MASYTGYQYRLRCGAPMPIASNNFALHTFMAEKSQMIFDECTSSLPSSKDFRGQGGSLVSAQYSRLGDHSGVVFSGKKVYSPTYIDEDVLNLF